MRLIDADAFKIRDISPSYWQVVDGVTEYDIEDAPTVDAVPVIRCKDCVRYKIFGDGYCPWIEQEVEEDFFCADGKRKEE